MAVTGNIKNSATQIWVAVLSIALIGAIFFAANFGSTANHWLNAFSDPVAKTIFFDIRLPRVLAAALIGSLLAAAGVLTQGVVRNGLASPGLIGVSIGAAMGAAAVTVFAGKLNLPDWLNISAISTGAFISAMAVAGLVLKVAQRGQHIDAVTLLLTGVAINAFGGAALAFLSYIATDMQLRSLSYWTMGSLSNIGWSTVLVLLGTLLFSLWPYRQYAKPLDYLALGEREAVAAGVDAEKVKKHIFLLVALTVAIAVSLVGAIGFVGLVVPHITRLLFGVMHQRVIPLALLIGAILMVLADLASRMLLAPTEIPIGIITALIGGPYFFYLLWQQRGRW